MKLLDQGKLPSWALFVYSSMKVTARDAAAPEPLAAIGDGVILLAPKPKNGGMEGLLLATHRAAGKDVEVTIAGHKTTITLPDFDDSVIAREDVYVPAS